MGIMRTVSSVTQPLIRYCYPPLTCALGIWSIAVIDRPISGSLLLAFGLWSYYAVRQFSTVVLTSSHIVVRSGFKELLLDYSDIESVHWLGKTDVIRLDLRATTDFGKSIRFKAKARCWVAKPHPIVSELQELCGLTAADSLE